MGIQGFPTLKLVRPGRGAPGVKPVVEDYSGARTAKAIAAAALDRMPNHVARLKGALELDAWLGGGSGSGVGARALFISDRTAVGAMLKALAVDFLGGIAIAQVKSADAAAAADKYGVTAFPAVVLLPAGGAAPLTYNGDMKKAPLVDFLTQAHPPNPDPPVGKAKARSKPQSKKSGGAAKSAKPSAQAGAATDPLSSSSSNAATAPAPAREALALASLDSPEALQKSCLHGRATTCILALLPSHESNAVADADTSEVQTLRSIARKHASRGARLFPIYAVPARNGAGAALASALQLGEEEGAGASAAAVRVVAVNAKRGWWTAYAGGEGGLERWIDSIRFDEVRKELLPEGVVGEVQEEMLAEEKEEAKQQQEQEQRGELPVEFSAGAGDKSPSPSPPQGGLLEEDVEDDDVGRRDEL